MADSGVGVTAGVPSVEVVEAPVFRLSSPTLGPGDVFEFFRMLPILPNKAPNPLDAFLANPPGCGGGEVTSEEFLRSSVGGPMTFAALSAVDGGGMSPVRPLTGDSLPEVEAAGLGSRTATGKRPGETLRCLP